MNTEPKNFNNINILYVEDESIIRTNVECCLKYIFNVIIAKDGQEGLDAFKKSDIHLVITDINMPNKDGIEMIKDIRAINPSIPCIVTTAYDVEVEKRIEAISNCLYISKPFDIKALVKSSMEILSLEE